MPPLLTLQRNEHPLHVQGRRPFSRIVVGVDASPASERALRLALSMARSDARVEFVFVHVIDIPRMLARADRIAEDYEIALEVAREEARGLLDRCGALAGEVGAFARSSIRCGNPAAEIVTLADVYAADLIVIGNEPKSKIHRLLNGSVSDDVVRTSAVPVLVVKD